MDLDAWILRLKGCHPLDESEVKLLCERAIEILAEEGNVQHIEAPVTICASRSGCAGRCPGRHGLAALRARIL